MRWCDNNVDFKENFFSHLSQANGFSPVCVLMCLVYNETITKAPNPPVPIIYQIRLFLEDLPAETALVRRDPALLGLVVGVHVFRLQLLVGKNFAALVTTQLFLRVVFFCLHVVLRSLHVQDGHLVQIYIG